MNQPDTDLRELDTAVRGEPGADATWLALVADVRADVPPRTLAATESLEARVAAGFPKPARRRRLPRWALPGLAVAAAVCVAGVTLATVVVPGDDGVDDVAAVLSAPSAGLAEPEIAQDSAPGAASAAPGVAIAPAPPEPGRSSKLGGPRKVERSTALALQTSARELQSVSDGVVRTTQALGGVVVSSQVDTTEREGSASLQLDVPTARLDEAVKRLSALASVASMSQAAQDVTGSFVSAQDRLSDARAERRALLRALQRATSATQIAALRSRIAANRSRLARAKGDLDALRRRVDSARIDVSVVGRGDAVTAPGDDDAGWTPGDALRDAGRVLQVVAGAAIIAAAVLGPLGALLALGLVVRRAVLRRRREAALTPG